MRVISSPEVLAAAEGVVKRLIDTYSKPDITFCDIELKMLVQDGSFDLLRDFSESCRAEFEHLRAQYAGVTRGSRSAGRKLNAIRGLSA